MSDQQNQIQRMQQLAGLTVSENHEESGKNITKTVIGHVDDEVHNLKKLSYQMGTYCVELFKILDSLPENSDIPHWVQAKMVKAQDYLSTSKHWMENEIAVPDHGAEPIVQGDDQMMMSPDAEDYSDPSGLS